MKRASVFMKGFPTVGKLMKVPDSLEEFLLSASQKFNVKIQTVFNVHGAEINDVELIICDDIIYVSTEEPFINCQDESQKTSKTSKNTDNPHMEMQKWNNVERELQELKRDRLADSKEFKATLQELKYQLDILLIDRGYSILGEKAMVVLDSPLYKNKNSSHIENIPPNPRTSSRPLKRKSPSKLLPTPQLNEFVLWEDLAKYKGENPTEGDLKTFLINCREVRHGIVHGPSHYSLREFKTEYDRLQAVFSRHEDDELEICAAIQAKATKLDPSVVCPSFQLHS